MTPEPDETLACLVQHLYGQLSAWQKGQPLTATQVCTAALGLLAFLLRDSCAAAAAPEERERVLKEWVIRSVESMPLASGAGKRGGEG